MNKAAIKIKRKLEQQKYINEYRSNKQHYLEQTTLLVCLQIPFLEIVEEQLKINANSKLKALHFALKNWVNEPIYSGADADVVQHYTNASNIGFECVELILEKIK